MEPRPALVMVVSIQTMRTGDSTSSPGSVTQVQWSSFCARGAWLSMAFAVASHRVAMYVVALQIVTLANIVTHCIALHGVTLHAMTFYS